MKAREFKDKVYAELSAISKAMASPHRLEILELLAQGASSVEYIAGQTGLSIANASQHLQVLRNARLVKTEKKGKYSYYSLAGPKVFEVWKNLQELGFSMNAEIEKLMKDFQKSRHDLESVTVEELRKRVEKGEAIALDVRPKHEYEEGHIPSAISLPVEELQKNLDQLPRSKQIIAYCRGPLCAMADDAVELLSKKGFEVIRMEEGYPEWKAKGYPVEQ